MSAVNDVDAEVVRLIVARRLALGHAEPIPDAPVEKAIWGIEMTEGSPYQMFTAGNLEILAIFFEAGLDPCRRLRTKTVAQSMAERGAPPESWPSGVETCS